MRKFAILVILLAFFASYASDPPRTKFTGVEVTRSLVLPDCDSDYSAKEPGELCRVPSTGEVKRWDGSSWVAIGGGEGTEDVSYTVENASGTYRVRNADGSVVYSSSDAGDAIDYAIDACAPSGGTVVLRPGDTFTYSSTIPTFEPNNTSWVKVIGYGATVKPSASAPMAFYFHKHSDGDNFDYWMIEGLTIDASSVTGKYAMIGGYNNGSHIDKVSYTHFILRDLEFVNLASDSTTATHLGAIGLTLRTSAGTDVEISNGYIENIRIFGGNWGIHLDGNVAAEGPYQYVKHITVQHVFHDMRPSGHETWDTTFGSTTVHIGNQAKNVEDIRVLDVTCYANGDNCVEIDQAMSANVSDITAYNPKSCGITVANQNAISDPLSQRVSFSDVHVIATEYRAGGLGRGICIEDTNPIGVVSIDNLAYNIEGPITIPDTVGFGPVVSLTAPIRALLMRGITYCVDGITFDDSGGNNRYPYGIHLNPADYDWSGDGTVDMDDAAKVTLVGFDYNLRAKETETGTGKLYVRGINVDGPMNILLADLHMRFDAMDGYLTRADGIYSGGSAGTVTGQIINYDFDTVGSFGSSWLTWTGGHLSDVLFANVIDHGHAYHFDAADTIDYGMTTDTYDTDEDGTVETADVALNADMLKSTYDTDDDGTVETADVALNADMLKSVYDTDTDSTVDLAEGIRSSSGSEIDSDADSTPEARVSADGTLSFDGKLQIGDADATTNAFCETRLSGDVVLLDADCDGTQDSDETCLVAGGRDEDCDGTAERELAYKYNKYNLTANVYASMNASFDGSYLPLNNDFEITFMKCWATEDIQAGTVDIYVRVYDSVGGSYNTAGTLSFSSSDSAYTVKEAACTSNCTGSGKFLRVVAASSSDYADDGADYTSDYFCIVWVREE